MPRRPPEIKRPRGSPPLPIDWEKVDEWLISGCKGTEIAPRLGIHLDTLYDRCVTDKGVLFSEYAAKKKSQGDGILRDTQFKTAKKGNVTMQIWLGKQRLDQKENPGVLVIPAEVADLFKETMRVLADRQDALKIEDSNNLSA